VRKRIKFLRHCVLENAAALPIQAQDKFKQKNGGVSAGIIIGGYTLMQNPPGLGK
jgi:hypothetical protein